MVYPLKTSLFLRRKILDFFLVYFFFFQTNYFPFPMETVGEQLKTTQWRSLPFQWPEQWECSPDHSTELLGSHGGTFAHRPVCDLGTE